MLAVADLSSSGKGKKVLSWPIMVKYDQSKIPKGL